MPDVAVANSDATNHIFLNRIQTRKKAKPNPTSSSRPKNPARDIRNLIDESLSHFQQREEYLATDWPAFRGLGARGVAEGYSLPTKWNADSKSGELQNVLWQVEPPGLGHSSPVVAGNQLFLVTSVATEGKAPLQVESGGKPTAADDNGVQDWLLLCYEKTTGKELWRRTLRKGKPRATRHAKATHANTSVSISENKIVTFLGSEGLYCHDLQGKLLWSQDLGVINISKYGIGWGFSSSPAVFEDRIVLVCDDPENPFIAARSLKDGKEVWRKSRKGICERSWGTPLIYNDKKSQQIVVNGWPWIVSYNLTDGSEVWRIKGGGDNPVPTPFEAHGLIYITNAHGGPSPIFAIRPHAVGDLSTTLTPNPSSSKQPAPVAWSIDRGGSYMSTPVVYGDQMYVGSAKGVIRSFDAKSGKKIYESRLGTRAGIIASLVAGDQKIYCASENGIVYVLEHGQKPTVLAKNKMGDPLLATPAVSSGTLFFRTTKKLIAIRARTSK